MTLGEEAQSKYEIIINDPERVAQAMASGMVHVKNYRRKHKDAYYFNWLLQIQTEFQQPFEPTHENMASLALVEGQSEFDLAANLRCALSGIVAGNVKEPGIRAIEEHGPFKITGDDSIMGPLDELLASFVEQRRMKINYQEYQPCYSLVTDEELVAES